MTTTITAIRLIPENFNKLQAEHGGVAIAHLDELDELYAIAQKAGGPHYVVVRHVERWWGSETFRKLRRGDYLRAHYHFDEYTIEKEFVNLTRKLKAI